MAKRSCPFDETDHYVKKQVGAEKKVRGIKSSAAERTLQLLFEGAARKQPREIAKKEASPPCVLCAQLQSYTQCHYCDICLCLSCVGICKNCKGEFCHNCSFPNYEEDEVTAVHCYSCY